jgi:hypothetical protein
LLNRRSISCSGIAKLLAGAIYYKDPCLINLTRRYGMLWDASEHYLNISAAYDYAAGCMLLALLIFNC